MTAEQMEELLGMAEINSKIVLTGAEVASLARRVLAAEKLAEAGRAMANDAEHGFVTGLSIASWGAAETAYREASK